jgi:tight adherence protein B
MTAVSVAAAAAVVLILALSALATSDAPFVRTSWSRIGLSVIQWRDLFSLLLHEGRVEGAFGGRRAIIGSCAVAAVAGFSLLGILGATAGIAVAPFALRLAIRARRDQYAAKIDACAAELALALASALAAGHSVRGALLVAGQSTPEPLNSEVDKLAVDLTLGSSISDALAALRSRTSSSRIESLVGAIELHKGSGGDLVQLMRELAESFRARDRAKRDAHSATAQARFTAIVVAAMPLGLAIVIELAKPGSITGALAYLPTAVMMVIAAGLMAIGGWATYRIGRT